MEDIEIMVDEIVLLAWDDLSVAQRRFMLPYWWAVRQGGTYNLSGGKIEVLIDIHDQHVKKISRRTWGHGQHEQKIHKGVNNGRV
jgi:hypothetical protein